MDPDMAAPYAPDTLDALYDAMAQAVAPASGQGRFVPGEGPLRPRLMLVGEQPGEQEDREGRPFVGPAGRLLATALGEVGLARDSVYLTNAVKRFHFTERGRRRLHRTPTADEIRHERWWIERETALVDPAVVVALGRSAAMSLTGRAVTLVHERGPVSLPGGRAGYLTVHPSALLRIPDATARASARAAFEGDLGRALALAQAQRVQA